MGLIVDVLKASGERESRTLVQIDGLRAPGPFEPTPERPAVLIDAAPMGYRGVFDAVECSVEDGDEKRGYKPVRHAARVGPMANGRWIYCPDVSIEAPLRYFDRWETPAQYASND